MRPRQTLSASVRLPPPKCPTFSPQVRTLGSLVCKVEYLESNAFP